MKRSGAFNVYSLLISVLGGVAATFDTITYQKTIKYLCKRN